MLGLGLALAATLPGLSAAPADDDELLDYAQRARIPPGYPAAYQNLVRAAEDEGHLAIYGTTDENLARPLLDDFAMLYPRVQVAYEDLTSTELHHRYIAETQLGSDSADVLWSTAMDLQATLVDRGYSLPYASPEAAALPEWARLRDEMWATTFEPIAIAYDKRVISEAQVPRSHADLAKLLATGGQALQGKVITYDIEKSGVGYLLAAQDAQAGPSFWAIAEGMGRSNVRFAATTAAMLRQITTGRAAIAYNVLAAYAAAQARRDTEIGWVLPSDYTLVLSRLQFISKRAAHPNAARLWVDYTLSRRGQTLLADRAGLYAIRGDVTETFNAAALTRQLGAQLRPIGFGPELTRPLDLGFYRDFVRRWRAAIGRRM